MNFSQKKKIMYVNKGKLPTSGISQPILQLVILNLSSDRRNPSDFDARALELRRIYDLCSPAR